MKKMTVVIVLIMLFATLLAACANADLESTEEMINPGDKIGDFLITTGNDEDITYVSKAHCPFDPGALTETCEIPVGTKVNVSISVLGEDYSGKNLDVYWSGQTYEMIIEDRPVNLKAFGPIDISHPVAGKMRNWNVVIVTDKPGKITIQHSGEVDGESMEGTNILIYTAP